MLIYRAPSTPEVLLRNPEYLGVFTVSLNFSFFSLPNPNSSAVVPLGRPGWFYFEPCNRKINLITVFFKLL